LTYELALDLAIASFFRSAVHYIYLSVPNGRAIVADMQPASTAAADLEPWLAQLRALPFVRTVRVHRRAGDETARAVIHTALGKTEYLLELARVARLGPAQLAPLAARAKRSGSQRVLLLGPYIPAASASRLEEAGIDFLDASGNCHLSAVPHFLVHVEGRKALQHAPRADGRAKPRSAGQHVLFALAARPELAAAPVRELARVSGAGKSACAEMLSRLAAEGLLSETRSGRRVQRPKQLLERWLGVYPDLRRRWLQGCYRAADSPEQTEIAVERALRGASWAWGGTAAEMRLVGHYRGPQTVVHVARPAPDLARAIRALPDRNGPIQILVTPIPLAFEGVAPNTAHPLLVYAELVASGDERSHAAAELVAERWLRPAA
jgi:hypothetical protein